MKNTRKLLAAVMALTMVSAIAPMSAFAIDQDDVAAGRNTGTMTATYDVTAKYTVTIPAGVTLDSTNAVSKNIEASDVMLESGKKIKVTLTEASNTASGSSFSAKNDKGDSTARYTISKGETAVAVGDVVAEFTEDGEQSLTFSKAEGASYAGTHTETLTFGIAVESPAPSLSDVFVSGTTISLQHEAIGSTVTRSFRNDDGTFTFTSNQYRQFAIMEKTDDSHFTITSTVNGDYLPSNPTYVDTFCVKYTFDTTNNTYTMTKGSNVYSSYNVTLDNIKVNDVEIPVTLTE